MNPDYEKAKRLLMIATYEYEDIVVFEPPRHGHNIDTVHVISPSGIERQWNVESPEARLYTAKETMEDILDVLERWIDYRLFGKQ